MFETGHFPNLLQAVLHELGAYVRPLYETRRVSEPPRACYYITRIHVTVMDAGDRGFRTLSAHESLIPLMFETGHFPNLLQAVLHELGAYVRPLYETRRVSEPPRACYYITRIHVTVMDAGDRGFRTLSAHESLIPLSTYAASVSDAARRTLWSLSHTYRQQLQNTRFRHLPQRLRGENQTNIVPGEPGEDRLNTLAGVVAGLNTDLDSATLDLSRVHLELENAHARIAALEAQL